jgi:hypothetical protein
LSLAHQRKGRGRREGGTPSSTTEEESLPIDYTGGEEEEE